MKGILSIIEGELSINEKILSINFGKLSIMKRKLSINFTIIEMKHTKKRHFCRFF